MAAGTCQGYAENPERKKEGKRKGEKRKKIEGKEREKSGRDWGKEKGEGRERLAEKTLPETEGGWGDLGLGGEWEEGKENILDQKQKWQTQGKNKTC